MRIGLRDIDPHIAQIVMERICVPLPEFLKDDIHWGGMFMLRVDWRGNERGPTIKRKRQPTADEREAYDIRRKRDQALANRILMTTIGAIAAGSIASPLAMGNHFDIPALMAVGAGGLGAVWTSRMRLRHQFDFMVMPVEMRAVFPKLTLTRAERVYCDTILLLASLDVVEENETAVRATLQQLNDLLATSRNLEKRRLSLLPVMGTNSVEQLYRERAALIEKYERVSDGIARQSIEQSIKMCDARIEAANAFEQGLDRLRAQEEALVQTLSSAQTALARMHLISQPHVETLAHEIADSVATMNRQTYAVEQAVQEVMELRVG
jgi:hypothetical protein